MTEKIEMPCLRSLKIACLAKHLFMFNSHVNLIKINYCLALTHSLGTFSKISAIITILSLEL
jgi:hypothetical protein